MQPHSMAMIPIIHRVFYAKQPIKVLSAQMNVDFIAPDGRTRSLKYSLSDFNYQTDRLGNITTFEMMVRKSGDPLSCRVKVARNTDGYFKEGENISMTHGTQHRAGFEERFKLYRQTIRHGEHLNSLKYRRFYGTISENGDIQLRTDIFDHRNKQYREYGYKLKVDTLRTDPIEQKKPENQKILQFPIHGGNTKAA